jgi:hypothetical protein
MRIPKLSVALLVFSVVGLAQDGQNERFRAKYGRYPPAIEKQHEEWRVAWKERAHKLFHHLDKNRDGAISHKEWRTANAFLNRIAGPVTHPELDHDRDGAITLSEWTRSSGD